MGKSLNFRCKQSRQILHGRRHLGMLHCWTIFVSIVRKKKMLSTANGCGIGQIGRLDLEMVNLYTNQSRNWQRKPCFLIENLEICSSPFHNKDGKLLWHKWVDYYTFQKVNDKGADAQTCQRLCCSHATMSA